MQIKDGIQARGSRVRHQAVERRGDGAVVSDIYVHEVMRIACPVARGSTAMLEYGFRTAEARQFCHLVMTRIKVIAHVIRVDLATGEIRIPRMCGLSRRRRKKNITISVGPVTHVDEEWIGNVIRKFFGREGGRHLVLASVGASV